MGRPPRSLAAQPCSTCRYLPGFLPERFSFLDPLPQPRPPWHPLSPAPNPTPASQSPGTCFLPLVLGTSPSRNLGVPITPPPRADPPSVLPLPAPGACNQSQAPAGFSGWGWRWCPKLPSRGVAGLSGSPEPWDVLLSSGKEPGLNTGTLGVWSQESREGVFQGPRVSRV